MGFLFTSEAVTGGHPDKLADTISDSITIQMSFNPVIHVAKVTKVEVRFGHITISARP